jgi:ATP-dependent DNA helicase RecQ
VPAYVIFHDTTLVELARHQPTDVDALRGISGIGERKLAQWGHAVCEVIRTHGRA